jgi:DNA-binding GntR family transcriptional regulator
MPAITPATAISHGLRRQAILESLLSDVMHGRLRPGQHLVTQDLAQRYGTSHTPIREALIALAGIGMITLLPNRGATVRQVTTQDIREICQVRRALECEAVRSACGRIELAQLEALREAFAKLNTNGGRQLGRFIERAPRL